MRTAIFIEIFFINHYLFFIYLSIRIIFNLYDQIEKEKWIQIYVSLTTLIYSYFFFNLQYLYSFGS